MCPEIEAQRKRLDRRTIFLDEDQGLCTFGAGAAEARKAEGGSEGLKANFERKER